MVSQKNKKYQLGQYVRVGIQNNKLYLGFGSLQKCIEDTSFIEELLKCCQIYLTPTLSSEAESLGLGNAFNYLLQNRFLVDEYEIAPSRHNRSHLFYALSGGEPSDIQNTLAKKTVAILGCGGIGNIVGVNLATMGIGRLILVDDDVVEVTNLTRQILFAEENIGELKTEVLALELQRRNSEIKIEIITTQIHSEEQLQNLVDVDIFIVSADAGNILGVINTFCLRKNIPFLNVGYIEDIAVYGPFVIPNQTGCLDCQDIVAGIGSNTNIYSYLKAINANYQAPSIGPINMIAGSLATLDIIKFFGKFGEIQSLNRRVGLWTHELRIEYQDCSKNPNCKSCNP